MSGEIYTGKAKALVGALTRRIYHRQPLEAIEPEESIRQEVDKKVRQEAERKGRRDVEQAKKAGEAEKQAGQEAERAGEARSEWPDSELHIDMRGEGEVLTVTALAVTKLKEAIRDLTKDPEIGIRFMPSAADPTQFEMVLDKEKAGDQVVESAGLKILLLRPELSATLGGMVIDCQETPQGVRFTVLKPKLPPDSQP